MEEKDLVIIGSGPAGYVAAIRASQLGRKVTIIEKENLGGTCLNWGCIPSKALLKSAEIYTEIKNAARFGITVSGVEINFQKIVDRSRQVARSLGQGVTLLMKKNNVEVIFGTAKLLPQQKISITSSEDNKTYEISFKDVIIATGARPRLVGNFTPNGESLHTSRTILECRTQPKELLVIGAGAIGVEFAYLFSTLGTKVTLVEMQDQILPLDDTDVANELQKIFTRRGMVIKTSSKVGEISLTNGKVSTTISTPKGDVEWTGDACLMAIGVAPNTTDLGCEEVGLKLERGFINVNNKMETNLPHYYAIGDVTRPPLLAHKASHEAIVCAESLCGLNSTMSYDNIPACSYCRPQVASIGYTEKKLQAENIEYKSTKLPYIAIGKAQATAETEGFIKLLSTPNDDKILGVHILHPQAAELIAEACVLRKMNASISDIIETIHAHPTLSEGLLEVASSSLGNPMNS